MLDLAAICALSAIHRILLRGGSSLVQMTRVGSTQLLLIVLQSICILGSMGSRRRYLLVVLHLMLRSIRCKPIGTSHHHLGILHTIVHTIVMHIRGVHPGVSIIILIVLFTFFSAATFAGCPTSRWVLIGRILPLPERESELSIPLLCRHKTSF